MSAEANDTRTDEAERLRLHEALTRLVLALSDLTPLLLIVEDLHWADEATFDALSYLTRHLSESRVLLIGSYRKEDALALKSPWEGLQAILREGIRQRLLLSRLSEEETALLVQQGLGTKAPLFAARLYRETSGNPLFLLETVRSLHADGILYQDEHGVWSTRWDSRTSDYSEANDTRTDELPLPAAIEAVIEKRLGRLDSEPRQILALAAVLGSQVTLPLLLDISQSAKRATLAALKTALTP